MVQNLPSANVQCGQTTTFADISTWDDSPWVTAVGGSTPVVNSQHRLAGPPTLWRVPCCSSSAGFSKIFTRPAYQDGVASITGSSMRSTPDITMDGTDGTSEASPLFAGVLALATQENHGNLGPINPVLYGFLGPHGTRSGIVDVIGGNDSFTLPDNTVVPGFTAVKGFDVASGWGTVNAPVFVPSLVAATRAHHQEGNARHQAQAELIRLERAITVTPSRIAKGSSAHVVATGFLPLHPVRIYIGNRFAAKVRASAAGTVSYVIRPSKLHLSAGRHRITITGMLISATAAFRTS